MKNHPNINNNDIKVLGRVVSIATENKVAAAEQIFDEDFRYVDVKDYAWDNPNIIETTKGLDQYSINRLFGKKLKEFDDLDLESWILQVNKVISGEDRTSTLWNEIMLLKNRWTNEFLPWKTSVDSDIAWLKDKVNELLSCCATVQETLHNLPSQGGDTTPDEPEPEPETSWLVLFTGTMKNTYNTEIQSFVDAQSLSAVVAKVDANGNPIMLNNSYILRDENITFTSDSDVIHLEPFYPHDFLPEIEPGEPHIPREYRGTWLKPFAISGNAVVTATSATGLTGKCYVTIIEDYVYHMRLDPTEILLVAGSNNNGTIKTYIGSTCTNMYTDGNDFIPNIYVPGDDNSLSWYSSDSSVATVSNGIVTPVSQGTTTITCTYIDPKNLSHTATCQITVIDNGSYMLTLDKALMDLYEIGDSDTLTAIVNLNMPEDIVWTSDNSEIASITTQSNTVVTITGNSKGSTVIRATGQTSGIQATCNVNVNNQYHTVTFNINGGSGYIAEQRVLHGECAIEPGSVGQDPQVGEIYPAPTRAGYTLIGWRLDGSQNSGLYDFNTPVVTDIVLIAMWEQNEEPVVYHNVLVYDDNSSSPVIPNRTVQLLSTIRVAHGSTVTGYLEEGSDTMPVQPDIEGYTFNSWVNASTGLQFHSYDPINEDTVVYAYWTENAPEPPVDKKRTIIYMDCDPAHNFTVGDDSFKPFAKIISEDTSKKFSVEYSVGASIDTPSEADVKSAIKENHRNHPDVWTWDREKFLDNSDPEHPIYHVYHLVGWNNLPYGQVMPDGDEPLYVYAIWDTQNIDPDQTHDLIIKPNFADAPNSNNEWRLENGANVLDHGGTGLLELWAHETGAQNTDNDYILSGQWQAIGENANMITVHGQGTFCTFTTNGAGSTLTKTVTIQATHVDFAEPATITITLLPPVKYTITFNSDGGSAVAPVSYNYGETIAPVTPPTKNGYNFAGWDPALPATMPRNNLTVTALWVDTSAYSLDFRNNGVDETEHWLNTKEFGRVAINVEQAAGYPEDVIWSSSDTNVVRVESENSTTDNNGRFYSVGNGTATITGTGAISGKSDTLTVKVQDLNLSQDEIVIDASTDIRDLSTGTDNRKQLPTVTYDVNDTPVTVTWESLDTSVATIQTTPDGLRINPVSPGVCNFQASYSRQQSANDVGGISTAILRVIVKADANANPAGSKVVISPNIVTLNKGQSLTVNATTFGINLADYNWVLDAYPSNMVTITPSVDNSSCAITAGNTSGFAILHLQPIASNGNLTETAADHRITYDSILIEVLQ